MRWNRRYVLTSYIMASLWLVPLVAIVLFWVFSRMVEGIGAWLLWTGRIDGRTSLFGISQGGALAVLDMIVTFNLSFLVFTFSSLLVAIQVAGGQYTPRIIATTLLRDNSIRMIVGYFVFSLLFAVRTTTIMQGEVVYQLSFFIAALLGLVSIAIFLYLIDYAARFLRPVSIAARVGEEGLIVVRTVYPELSGKVFTGEVDGALGNANRTKKHSRIPDLTICHHGNSSILIAVDTVGLVELARNAKGVVEVVPQVGDFVAVDDPLFNLYDGARDINDKDLRASVAFGSERTVELDPTFAFRILVDMAIKALSPAINDPTTAVLCLDQLHRLLRQVGLRHLRGEDICDAAGDVRLIFRTPNWEDFVYLSCTEIRHFGASSVQVVRRLRSMLVNLLQTLPSHRHAELQTQLALLDRAIEGAFTFPEDRELARIPDPQGLGGSLGMQSAEEDAK